jgi:hypothetical protein
MNRTTQLSLSLLLAAVVTQPTSAQKSKGGGAGRRGETRSLTYEAAPGADSRARYKSGESDGIRLVIYRMSGGRLMAVDPGQAFKSGDRIRVAFESNFGGYVYVINLTPSGEARLLFPFRNRDNRVRAGQRYEVPQAGEFTFDTEPGTEVLQVLMSRTRVPFLEASLGGALKSSNNVLDESAARLLQNLTGKYKSPSEGGIVRYDEQASETRATKNQQTRSRSLTLNPGEEDSVLTVSGKKGLPGRLRPGEISVFEVRLKHI